MKFQPAHSQPSGIMPILDPTPVLLLLGGMLGGGALAWYLLRRLRPVQAARPRWNDDRVQIQMIADRVRGVGKLVALEVSAKEIATASAGWAWLPPLILSQAKLAMIFHFEKQYSLDLASIRTEDVRELEPGKCRLKLPPIEGTLRLTNMTPYDIQSARVLGLLDLIPMTAERQKELMERAQHQAAGLFETWEARYHAEARASAERHLTALMEMLGVRVELEWPQTIVAVRAEAEPVLAPATPGTWKARIAGAARLLAPAA